jgi:hypothetical protein
MKYGFMDTILEMKMQSSRLIEKNSPRPKNARWVMSNVKVVLTGFFFFFDIEDVVHHEFLLQGQTVNRWYYLKVMKRLRENVRRKRPQLWRNNSSSPS